MTTEHDRDAQRVAAIEAAMQSIYEQCGRPKLYKDSNYLGCTPKYYGVDMEKVVDAVLATQAPLVAAARLMKEALIDEMGYLHKECRCPQCRALTALDAALKGEG